MTVADLITALQQHDPSLPVVVEGFDSWGFDPVDQPEVVTLHPVKPASHGPAYQDEDHNGERTGPDFAALFLGRQ